MSRIGNEPPSSDITPEPLYLRRREFIRNAALFTATSSAVGSGLLWLLGGGRPTLFNGYAEQVASLYAGMDLTRLY